MRYFLIAFVRRARRASLVVSQFCHPSLSISVMGASSNWPVLAGAHAAWRTRQKKRAEARFFNHLQPKLQAFLCFANRSQVSTTVSGFNETDSIP